MAGKRVLVVDDDGAVRDTLARKLLREEFVVLMAKDGLEGLRVFHADHPDLVILDVVMPGMDGVTVCQRIREVADTPVMMLSAQALSEDAVVEGLNAGADEYLAKPVRSRRCCAGQTGHPRLRAVAMTMVTCGLTHRAGMCM